MTEAEWLACADPAPMLGVLRGKTSNRKLRLFGVTCCRRIWELMPDVKCELAVDIAESHADGHCEDKGLKAISERVFSAIGGLALRGECAEYASTAAAWVSSQEHLTHTFQPAAVASALHKTAASSWAREWEFDKLVEHRHQAGVLRDIFGNPFRPVTCSADWRTDTVLTLVRQMYESRDFSAMPILADALQDAGCDNDYVLNHCRDVNQAHVRGCWVVDLVLGSE